MRSRIFLSILLVVLSVFSSFSRDLTTIKKSGKIYVGMTKDDLGTINYDLAVEFAKYLNVEFILVEITWEEAFMKNGVIPEDLQTNPLVIYNPDVFKKVDIICTTFTILEWRKKIFDFAETLNSAELLLVDKKIPPLRNFSDLSGSSIAFMEATSFETHLAEINEKLEEKIKLVPFKTNEAAKDFFRQEKVFGIVLDADEALNFNMKSNLKYRIAMPITPMTKTGWAMEKGNNLKNEVEDFFRTIESNEELDNLFNRRFNTTYSTYLADINKIILLEKHNHDLDKIVEEGEIVIGLREGQNIYLKDGKKQFMHALAEEFADYLGISLRYLITPEPDRYWENDKGKIIRDSIYTPDWFDYIDLACDEFIPQEWQKAKVSFVEVLPSVYWGLRKDQPLLAAELKKFISGSGKDGLIRSLLNDPLQSPETAILKHYEKSQTGQYPSVSYGTDNGLPQEDILTIFQDNKGYMWFGTCSGVVRYNGREMKTIGYSQELSDNSIRAINQDSAGLIYLASPKGISVIDKDTIIDQILNTSSFNSIFIDRGNNKWFSGSNGVHILTSDNDQRYLNEEFPNLPVTVNNINEDPKTGDIYIATHEGIFCYSPPSGSMIRMTDGECNFLFIDTHNHLWISGKSGLLVGLLADFKAGDFEKKAKNLNNSLHLENDLIKEIRGDKNGDVWLIFESRIIQMTANDQMATVYDQENGLKNNKILTSLSDREDNLWIGFNGGLQRLSSKQGLKSFFPTVINSYIYSIRQTADGRLWISSNNGVYYFNGRLVSFTSNLDSRHNGNESHNPKYVMDIHPDRNLIFASGEGIFEVNSGNLTVVRSRIFTRPIITPQNIFVSSKGEIFLLTGMNGVIYYLSDFYSTPLVIKDKNSTDISSLAEIDGRILGGNSNGIVEIRKGELKLIAATDYKIWSLYSKDSIVWAGSDRGLRKILNGDYENIQPVSMKENTVIRSIIPAHNKNYLWLGTNNGFAYFNINTNKSEFFINSKNGLSGDEITPAGLYLDRDNLLWIGTYHGISNFNLRAMTSVSYPPLCYLERVMMNGKEIDIKPGQSFRYNQNNFVFDISAISFSDEKSVEYEYYIRGTSNKYSLYNKGKEYKAYYNNLPPGRYEFIYKAKAKNNVQSYSQKYVFTIKPAWFNTWMFRVAVILLLALLIYLIYKARIRVIEAQKKWLEQVVKERTSELKEANEEIKAQRDVAASQRDQIAEQNKEITDSIYYAERIQRSMLPPVITLDAILPEHFILFKPRNIVSGDFYWTFEKGDKIFIAAVDCTGHGVPGALMSMLGFSFLNEITILSNNIGPDEILNKLRDSIIKALKQAGNEGESRDGMDVGILMFDKARTIISFAGANNPLYHIRNNELHEIKGDKMPVGIYERMSPFTSHTIKIEKGDTFYIFSDGYADQFGGPKKRKFMYSSFKKLLLSIQSKPVREHGLILDEKIKEWQGDNEQIDDIVVIGLRF